MRRPMTSNLRKLTKGFLLNEPTLYTYTSHWSKSFENVRYLKESIIHYCYILLKNMNIPPYVVTFLSSS